jgi:hypothetical protein
MAQSVVHNEATNATKTFSYTEGHVSQKLTYIFPNDSSKYVIFVYFPDYYLVCSKHGEHRVCSKYDTSLVDD